MRLSPAQWVQRCVFRRLRRTPGDSWVSGKVHLAFRWWVIAPSCLILSLSFRLPMENERAAGSIVMTAAVLAWVKQDRLGICGCEVRDGRVGGGFRPCSEVCFNWLKRDCTVCALWSAMDHTFVGFSIPRARGKHISKDTALWMLHSVTIWS